MNNHKLYDGKAYKVVIETAGMWVGYRLLDQDFGADVEIVDWSPAFHRKTVVSKFLLSVLISRFLYDLGDSVKHTSLGETTDLCMLMQDVNKTMEVTHDIPRDGSQMEEEGRAAMVDYYAARFA